MLLVALFAALTNVAFGAWTLKTSGVSSDIDLRDVDCYGSVCWAVGDPPPTAGSDAVVLKSAGTSSATLFFVARSCVISLFCLQIAALPGARRHPASQPN